MEGIQSPFLPGVSGPCLAAVEQCADDTGVVHCYLGLHCQLGVGPHTCCEARMGCGCLPDPLSISASRERLSVMVEPRYVN